MKTGFIDFNSKLNQKVQKKMAVQFLASHWKLLEKAYAEDNTKTVGQLMAEVEEVIAKEGYNVHEVLMNAK